MDKLKKAVETVKIVNTVEKGSASDAPSSVMVAVRCRPFNTREINQNEGKIVIIKENGYCAIQPPDDSAAPREFSFDYTYDDDSVQPTVYQNLGAPLLDKAFGGWNGTIFAYGQTGAGKSFSMTGSSSMPGIIPQMNAEMFERIAASTADNPNKLFLVTCSFMEIYNEVLYDLLDPTMGARGTNKSRKDSNIDVKEDPKLGVYVAGLQEIGVDTKEKIEKLMDQGNSARAVAATQMNATSSRSHSIFIIRLQQKEVVAGQQKDVRATINLVDLAGSERVAKTGATGDKLKEGANINKSLSALGNVINALAEQAKKSKKVFIPYRNSKLTRVLQESLGGNSVTVMLAAISPAAYNYEETLNTLQVRGPLRVITAQNHSHTLHHDAHPPSHPPSTPNSHNPHTRNAPLAFTCCAVRRPRQGDPAQGAKERADDRGRKAEGGDRGVASPAARGGEWRRRRRRRRRWWQRNDRRGEGGDGAAARRARRDGEELL